MKVSIITPNYNGEKYLEEYFQSLTPQKQHIDEVIIIDNNSKDNSKQIIQKYQEKLNIQLIENNTNTGFAKACNQGIQKAKNEYLLLLNNDIKLEKNAIKTLIETIQENPKTFSVMSKMIQYHQPNLIDTAGDEYTILTYTQKKGNNTNKEKYNKKREIFSSCAGAALYKKSIIEQIGPFDENFFAYVEDIDLSYRAQIQGYHNIYQPESIVYHHGSATSGSKYNPFKIRLAARNNIYLIYKNYPIPQKILNFIFIFLGHLIKYLVFYKKGQSKPYLEGIKEGLKTRKQLEKTKYENKNIKNYLKIEWKLIINTIKLIQK